MASILNLQYNSAKQKLDGKRGITLDEIKRVFQYFNESFEGRRAHNCVFIMNSIHKRCNIEVDDKPVDSIEDGETYAFRKDDLFIINTGRDKSAGAELYKVRKIDFLPAPRIAILDNDQDILELLKKSPPATVSKQRLFQPQKQSSIAWSNIPTRPLSLIGC